MLVPKGRLADLYKQIKERSSGVEGCSVVLIVAPDADALAACKMLTVRRAPTCTPASPPARLDRAAHAATRPAPPSPVLWLCLSRSR